MVFVCPYLKKSNLISLTDPQTDLFKFLVHFGTKHDSPVLCWAYDVIQKYQNIMAPMNKEFNSELVIDPQNESALRQVAELIGVLHSSAPDNPHGSGESNNNTSGGSN